MRSASARVVRSSIAAHILGRHVETSRLGDVTLQSHQVHGVMRARRLLDESGGALLADDVGLGKTYIALAIARAVNLVVVIAPAALRETWTDAAARSGVRVRFVSVERLSRPDAPQWPADLVIVDEAHHLRNARTRRFIATSAVCRSSKVLLLSATPVQNRLSDLRTMLSLFLGEQAFALPAEGLSRFVIRRDVRDADMPPDLRLPRLHAPRWLEAIHDADCLDRLTALPRAVPPVDGDDGGVLLTYTLARQWASSRAALLGALRRRLARGSAMLDALRAGRRPSHGELTAWTFCDGAQQLAFPELIASHAPASVNGLLDQSQCHLDALRDLVAWLCATPDPDVARVATLRALLQRHAGERVIAFSEYADTVAALYRALVPYARVAMLTHAGGRVAGGRMTRAELLGRFAPGGSACMADRDRIDLLLTTDVLSEGVNLQDASVIVHVDLAWNPARLEQRVGRLRRIGATRDAIAVYMFPPPAPAERLLAMERRLRTKTSVAARAIGVAGEILPAPVSASGKTPAPPDERIATLLQRWLSPVSPRDPVAAAVKANGDGALACVSIDGTAQLVAALEDCVTDSLATIEDLLKDASGSDVDLASDRLHAVVERLERWLRRRVVTGIVHLPALRVGRARREILRRVDSIASRVPRHERSLAGPLMHAARAAATVTLSAGAEAVLDELARAPLGDQAWLKAVGEFAAVHARNGNHEPAILALLILCAP
jgi:hypothetical protein